MNLSSTRRRRDAARGAIAVVATTLTVLAATSAPARGRTTGTRPSTPTTTAAKAAVAGLVGTWEGDYEFPSPSGQVYPSHEHLVIDRQEGNNLWGHDEFVDTNGQTVRIPVIGSIHGRRIGLSEEHGFFDGRIVSRTRIVLRFWLMGASPTSFHLDLHRVKS